MAFNVFAYRRYDAKQELEFLLPLLRPGMTFFDVGANVGVFSMPAARKLREGRVYAFEPTSWTYERLVSNAQLNNLSNLLAFRTAVGDYNGSAVLRVNVKNKDGLNTLGKPAHVDSEVIGEEVIPITTVDDFVSQNSVSRIDVMKIDVEGAELFVLRGAKNQLRRVDAPLILYESGFLSKGFDYHPVEQMWLLEKYGYSFFLIDSRTGKICVPTNGRAYDSMVIAIKPADPAYSAVRGLAV